MASSRKRLASSRPAAKKTEPARPTGKANDIASQEPCSVRDIFKVHSNGGQIFLLEESFPCYMRSGIWDILQELGFVYKKGFRNEGLGGALVWDHEDQVRRYMVQMGIPSSIETLLEEKEFTDALKGWVAFAHVPLKASDALGILQKVALPSDYQALVSLQLLGFHIDGSTRQIYRTTVEGITEEFDSIRELRTFVRAVDNATLMAGVGGSDTDETQRKRARRTTRKQDAPLSDDALLALRLWAALSPDPLPGEPPEPNKKKQIHESNMSNIDALNEKGVEKDSQQNLSTITNFHEKENVHHPIATSIASPCESHNFTNCAETAASTSKLKTDTLTTELEKPTLPNTATISDPVKVPSRTHIPPEECSVGDSETTHTTSAGGNSCLIL